MSNGGDCPQLTSPVLFSPVRPGPDRQGQDRHLGPLRHRPGGQVQEEDQDHPTGAQPGVEREVLLVSL